MHFVCVKTFPWALSALSAALGSGENYTLRISEVAISEVAISEVDMVHLLTVGTLCLIYA